MIVHKTTQVGRLSAKASHLFSATQLMNNPHLNQISPGQRVNGRIESTSWTILRHSSPTDYPRAGKCFGVRCREIIVDLEISLSWREQKCVFPRESQTEPNWTTSKIWKKWTTRYRAIRMIKTWSSLPTEPSKIAIEYKSIQFLDWCDPSMVLVIHDEVLMIVL